MSVSKIVKGMTFESASDLVFEGKPYAKDWDDETLVDMRMDSIVNGNKDYIHVVRYEWREQCLRTLSRP
jgi:hypothetical protein